MSRCRISIRVCVSAMRASIRRVCKAAGVTAIYVTHDQQEALITGDRIAVLIKGRLGQVGTPRELYERPQSRAVAEFIGEANIIAATVRDGDSVDWVLGTLAATIPVGLSHLELPSRSVCVRSACASAWRAKPIPSPRPSPVRAIWAAARNGMLQSAGCRN